MDFKRCAYLWFSRYIQQFESFNFCFSKQDDRTESQTTLDLEGQHLTTTSMIDLPTSNFQAFDFGPNAPPGYGKTKDSSAPKTNQLFKSVEYAKDTTKSGYASFRRILALFFCSVTITGILIILMALPITMVTIGGIYIKRCTFQIMIPIWLIVFGSLLIIKNLSTLIQRIRA